MPRICGATCRDGFVRVEFRVNVPGVRFSSACRRAFGRRPSSYYKVGGDRGTFSWACGGGGKGRSC